MYKLLSYNKIIYNFNINNINSTLKIISTLIKLSKLFTYYQKSLIIEILINNKIK